MFYASPRFLLWDLFSVVGHIRTIGLTFHENKKSYKKAGGIPGGQIPFMIHQPRFT